MAEENDSQNKSFLDKLRSTIQNEINDLSYIEVITAISDDTLIEIDPAKNDIIDALRSGKQKIKILARTRIELDGDITMILPGDKDGNPTNIDIEIMKMHKANVDAAVQNCNNFLHMMLDALRIVISLVDPAKASLLKEINIGTISPSS